MFEPHTDPPPRPYAALICLGIAAVICLLGFSQIGFFAFIGQGREDALGNTIGGMLLLLLSAPFVAAGLWLDYAQSTHEPMRPKWGFSDTFLPKAIAVIAVLGILGFGLCTAGVMTQTPVTNASRSFLRALFPACAYTAIFSVPVLIVLGVVKTWKRLGRARQP